MESVRPSDLLVIQEEATPPGLQRLWGRRTTSIQLVEDDLFEDAFFLAQDIEDISNKSQVPNSYCEIDATVNHVVDDYWESEEETPVEPEDSLPLMCLDAASLGDIPARYVIPSLPNHEFPAIGVFVDPRIVPGFKYRVRVLPDLDRPFKTSYLFEGKALTLESIGRGYSRRLSFAPDENTTLNNNENYFWADSRSEGYGFELQVISAGDKFMVHDPNQVVAGTIEVVQIQGSQEEVSHNILKDGAVEKRARVKALCKVEWFDDSGATILLPMSGIAVCVKKKGAGKAELVRIMTVTVGSHHHKRGFTLTPGVKTNWRRTTVNGSAFGDVPAKYTITGLESFELPVIGTYVDQRITPGFRYRVRQAGSKKKFFDGRALRLLSVGMGYAKRITFEPNSDQLNQPENHFWSDSNPDGYGFEPVAVDVGMKFTIQGDDQPFGHAQIFRADIPQQEIDQKIEKTEAGNRVMKYIDIDVTCHVTFTSESEHERVIRVTGTAVLSKDANSNCAKLIRIENIGLDSQINLLFVREHHELVLLPK